MIHKGMGIEQGNTGYGLTEGDQTIYKEGELYSDADATRFIEIELITTPYLKSAQIISRWYELTGFKPRDTKLMYHIKNLLIVRFPKEKF